MRKRLAKRSLVFSITLTGVFVLSLTGIVHAVDEAGMISYANCEGAGGFVPLECFRDSAKLTDAYTTNDLKPFLNKVFVGAISLGAIIAVLRLAWAGFQYMASDLWSSKEKAKENIRETLLGLFLLIAIYLILRTINPQILSLNVTATQLSPAPTSAAPAGSPYDSGPTRITVNPFDVYSPSSEFAREVAETQGLTIVDTGNGAGILVMPQSRINDEVTSARAGEFRNGCGSAGGQVGTANTTRNGVAHIILVCYQ